MKIGLQNFQGIGAYTEIPIAPITLFYGPNSAGKSTVADAFNFLRSTLSGSNKDWQKDLEKHARRNRIERPLIDGYIGDPHDVAFTVVGKSYFDGSDFNSFCLDKIAMWPESAWLSTHEGIEEIFAVNDKSVYTESKQFEYQIHFAQNCINSWVLSEYLLILDGLPLFRIQAQPSLRIQDSKDDIEYGNHKGSFNVCHPAYKHLEKLDGLIRWWFYDDDEIKFSRWDEIVDEGLCWRTFARITADDPFSPINFHDDRIDDTDPDIEILSRFAPLSEYLNFFVAMPTKWASYSCAIYTVPPLRPLPENLAALEIGPSYVEKQCWEVLADDVRKITLGEEPDADKPFALTFINEILTSHDFMATGYSITGDVKFNFLLDLNEFTNLVNSDTASQQQKLLYTPAIVHLYLIYLPEKFRVEIADVGVGISQVVPVLFGCWQAMSARNGVHIQQPELHLHPKLQAQLADVFIKCVNAPIKCGIFLLESHSEHLLLRLLRRIRESHMAEVNLGKNAPDQASVTNMQKVKGHALKADQVSVVYVSKDESGITKMKPLRLSDDGEFIDRWPNGFFTERDIELFGEEGPFI